MLEDRLPALKEQLIEYGSLVETMIDKAIQGLMRKDRIMLSNVIDRDEPRANALEIGLDELCTTLIAQYQPIARDLRTVLMILKMNSDLERMADHAVNIAESAMFLVERAPVKPLLDIPRMAEGVVRMVSDSLRSFITEDAKLAKSVCERDDEIDSLARQVLRELITYMSADPSTIERGLHLLDIAGNLERIADLSTNIGEDVIFMVEGRVIKHHKEEE
ncbi:MAG TPA: phosphate signaling complex protein PhoU, partial [Syntrophorhabdales bacterium]|nr:phosphate signaling complex protein PhoU [Syntrophorhabdales bacterium]